MNKQSKSILIVDDFPSNLLIASTLVEMAGYTCDLASSGEIAMEFYHKGDYEFVLMDVNMPLMDGISTARKMRDFESQVNKPPTPIIAISADISAQNKQDCIKGGMDDFIGKPYLPEELYSKLNLHSQRSAHNQ